MQGGGKFINLKLSVESHLIHFSYVCHWKFIVKCIKNEAVKNQKSSRGVVRGQPIWWSVNASAAANHHSITTQSKYFLFAQLFLTFDMKFSPLFAALLLSLCNFGTISSAPVKGNIFISMSMTFEYQALILWRFPWIQLPLSPCPPLNLRPSTFRRGAVGVTSKSARCPTKTAVSRVDFIHKQVDADTNLSQRPATIVIAVVAILTGLVFTFFGRKLLRPILFLTGFYLCSLITLSLLYRFEPKNGDGTTVWTAPNRDWIFMGVCAGAGILGGILLSVFHRLGVCLVGLMGGFTLSLFIMSFFNGDLIQKEVVRNVIAVAFAVAGAVLAVIYENTVVIICTSMFGSYIVMFGVDLMARTGFATASIDMMKGQMINYRIENKAVYGLMVATVILAIIGIVVQFRTARNRKSSFQQYQTPF